jgi:hypothetical protein
VNPDEEILSIEEGIDELLEELERIIASGETISDEVLLAVANEIQEANARIVEIEEGIEPQLPQVNANIPTGADLLWILSGGEPKAFTDYLTNFPDPALNALAKNPEALANVIERLKRTVTIGAGEAKDGIARASLQSSNVWGFRYSPKDGSLLIKFQGNDGPGRGPIYKYDGVPPLVFKMFQAGAVPAKTTGQNQWGRWWKNKTPSLGSAMHSLIKMGGYPYTRIS